MPYSSLKNAIGQDESVMRTAIFALVVELVYSDGIPADIEWKQLKISLGGLFGLPDDVLMAELNTIAAKPTHSVNGYCHLLAEKLDDTQKYQLLTLLWHIAYADDVIDVQEIHSLRYIAKQLGLSTSEFAKVRNQLRSP